MPTAARGRQTTLRPVSARAADIQGKYVSSITITGGGITVTYGNEANATNLAATTVGLQPGASANGDVIWKCGYGRRPVGLGRYGVGYRRPTTTVEGKYLPSVCRVSV